MKTAAIAIAIAVLGLAAGSASAAGQVSDLDYMKANRCKGLATTLTGVADPASMDAFIKSARGSRAPHVLERAEAEFDRAKREARSVDRRGRLTAELTGYCAELLGQTSTVAGARRNPG